jgi:hypothetical protein
MSKTSNASTVVELSSLHPMVEGSSPVIATEIGGEKRTKYLSSLMHLGIINRSWIKNVM